MKPSCHEWQRWALVGTPWRCHLIVQGSASTCQIVPRNLFMNISLDGESMPSEDTWRQTWCLQGSSDLQWRYCWWFRNPAPVDMVVHPIICDGFKKKSKRWCCQVGITSTTYSTGHEMFFQHKHFRYFSEVLFHSFRVYRGDSSGLARMRDSPKHPDPTNLPGLDTQRERVCWEN